MTNFCLGDEYFLPVKSFVNEIFYRRIFFTDKLVFLFGQCFALNSAKETGDITHPNVCKEFNLIMFYFKAIIASRGYHVYEETSWSNSKINEEVKVELETNTTVEISIADNEDDDEDDNDYQAIMIESEETDSQETEAQSEIQETETESQSSNIDLQINEDIPVPTIID